jgi:hypothetical protein
MLLRQFGLRPPAFSGELFTTDFGLTVADAPFIAALSDTALPAMMFLKSAALIPGSA